MAASSRLRAYDPGEQTETPGDQWGFMSEAMGFNVAQAYTDYVKSMHSMRRGQASHAEDDAPLSPQEWLNNAVGASVTDDIMRVLDERYQRDTQQDMPPELREQIRKQVETASADTKAQLLLTMRAYQGDAKAQRVLHIDQSADPTQAALDRLQSFTGIVGLVPKFEQSHPSPELEKQAQIKAMREHVLGTLGHVPSDVFVESLVGKSDEEVSNILDGQTLANGMQLGAYHKASNRINPLWERYFGAQPTDDQIKSLATKSDADLYAVIGSGKSHFPGLDVAHYEGYSNAIQQLSQQHFGYSDKSLTDSILQAMKGPGQ